MTVEIVTFGCRLNTFESEVMRGLAHHRDTVIVNTCAVTAEAERQARQAIRKLARERPEARIVVTGCAAQIDPAAWSALPGVHRVLGNTEKLLPGSWADGAGSEVGDIMNARQTAAHLVTEFAGRARAFVQVQQGCDHRCTFCVIPFGRGPNRSVPMGEVTRQVRLLTQRGFNEIVLTGVDIASYGADLPGRPALGQLARRLLARVPELPRLRLSSLDPAAIDEELWRLIAEEPRLMPHLHLSLQAGSGLILKRMKRRHTPADAAAVIARARAARPGIAIGADLIAGFPTETDALFQETLDFVENERAAVPARVSLLGTSGNAGRENAGGGEAGAQGPRGAAAGSGSGGVSRVLRQPAEPACLDPDRERPNRTHRTLRAGSSRGGNATGYLYAGRIVGTFGDALLAEAA